MSTLTPMEKTAGGWRCPRCGSTLDDGAVPVRATECSCEGLGLPPVPRKGWVSEEAATATERERLEALKAAMSRQSAAESKRIADEVDADPLVRFLRGDK